MRFLPWIFVIGFFSNVTTYSQNWSNITEAINGGDAQQLSQYFSDNVEVAVLDQEDLYPKKEAGRMVAEFFSSNPVKSFSQVHRGNSRSNDSQYCIGNLVTSTGNFRVYIYVSEENGTLIIQELRFDQG